MSSSQNPLTETPAPELDWSRDGTPASTGFGDIYFSVDGGLDETQEVFLKACDLPHAWQNLAVFNIFELGFGSGLNFLACWNLWANSAPENAELHFISVEAYPWSKEELEKALSHFPSLSECAQNLIQQWPGRVKGTHRLHFGNVHLTLYHTEVDQGLNNYNGPKINAWFLDGFSPSKNPDMWAQPILNRIGELSVPGARVGTFTVAGHVRRGLAQAGFNVQKLPGYGRKRERLEAVFPVDETKNEIINSARSPIIIGAGIAGASIARAFLRRGIIPVLIDKETDLQTAASGNPAAMVMPRLDLQDRPESRFFLSAYLYAIRAYRHCGTILHNGAIHFAKSENENVRFSKISDQRPLPLSELQLVKQDDAMALLDMNFALDQNGLYFPNAVTIDPKITISDWIKGATRINARIASIRKIDPNWHVYDENGKELAKAEKVFITVGADLVEFDNLSEVSVRFTRGQISWGQSAERPHLPATYGGYALNLGDKLLLGATHEHTGPGQNPNTNTSDNIANQSEYEAFLGKELPDASWYSRAAIRVTTKDTLPISTKWKQGLYIMTGLGSRGFMMAPLLGEALVCDALNLPSPLCAQTKMRFGTREKI